MTKAEAMKHRPRRSGFKSNEQFVQFIDDWCDERQQKFVQFTAENPNWKSQLRMHGSGPAIVFSVTPMARRLYEQFKAQASAESDYEQRDKRCRTWLDCSVWTMQRRGTTMFVRLDGDIGQHIDPIVTELEQCRGYDIDMTIRSNGGDVRNANRIVSALQAITASDKTVRTHGVGNVASAAVLLLAAGSEGHRSVDPDCELMLHLPKWNGQPVEAEMSAEDIRRKEEQETRLASNYAALTNYVTTTEQFRRMMERNGESGETTFYSARAIELGLCDFREDRNESARRAEMVRDSFDRQHRDAAREAAERGRRRRELAEEQLRRDEAVAYERRLESRRSLTCID